MSHNTSLLLLTLLAVLALVVLLARYKLNAFIGLTLASLFVGLGAGMSPPDIVKGFLEGVGAVAASVAMVVALGTVLGKLLAESGGAEVLSTRLTRALGQERLPWAMLLIAFLVGIPTWFTVGLVLLIPIVFTLARETKTPLLHLGLPLVAALSVAHGLVPPHPGPMAAIEFLKADTGKTILYSVLIGLPTAALAGPLMMKLLVKDMQVEPGGIGAQLAQNPERKNPPGVGLTVFSILLPILLMLLATAADVALPKGDTARLWLDFLGSPLVAMLVGVHFAYFSFGTARGFDRQRLAKFTDECLGPVAIVILVVGAGGGFSKVLVHAGVSDAVKQLLEGVNISPLLLGWLVAALIRIATGSATVAITTAAGILAPIAAGTPGLNRELLVIAMGAGSLILSHLNDGGFWFVKEYLNLSVAQTLKTWTVIETVISVVALVFTLAVNTILRAISH
jgi:GntP family gluconate:H+ symporter